MTVLVENRLSNLSTQKESNRKEQWITWDFVVLKSYSTLGMHEKYEQIC